MTPGFSLPELWSARGALWRIGTGAALGLGNCVAAEALAEGAWLFDDSALLRFGAAAAARWTGFATGRAALGVVRFGALLRLAGGAARRVAAPPDLFFAADRFAAGFLAADFFLVAFFATGLRALDRFALTFFFFAVLFRETLFFGAAFFTVLRFALLLLAFFRAGDFREADRLAEDGRVDAAFLPLRDFDFEVPAAFFRDAFFRVAIRTPFSCARTLEGASISSPA